MTVTFGIINYFPKMSPRKNGKIADMENKYESTEVPEMEAGLESPKCYHMCF